MDKTTCQHFFLKKIIGDLIKTYELSGGVKPLAGSGLSGVGVALRGSGEEF